ncbi:MAG: hypothetical protein F4213_08140 [Boseongicola sp. SB0677_bin_26]|nr:hypothetical protein [Boseongicola sp. SB0677_bin_26]
MRIWLSLALIHAWAGALESIWLGGLSSNVGDFSLTTGIVEAYSLQNDGGFPGVLFAAGSGLIQLFEKLTIWGYAYLTGLSGLMLRGTLTLASIIVAAMSITGALGRVGAARL